MIVNNQHVSTSDITLRTWVDDPRWHLKAGEDRYARTGVSGRKPDVQMVILHTTRGELAPVRPGAGPAVDPATKTLGYWNSKEKNSGAHLWVGPDGTCYQFADLLLEATPHAGNDLVNRLSVGIEMYQEGSAGNLYEAQLQACVRLVDNLTRVFNIARRFQWPYLKHPPARLARPQEGGEGGVDVTGVFGHRDASSNRGLEDPGQGIFLRLGASKYQPVDLSKISDDLAARRRAGQSVLGASRPGDGGNTLLFAAAGLGAAYLGYLGGWFSRKS